MDGKGPFSSLVMGVVVLKDVFVILSFALTIQLVPSILGTPQISNPGSSGGGADVLTSRSALGAVMAPVLSLAASVSVGLVGGYFLSLVLEHRVRD